MEKLKLRVVVNEVTGLTATVNVDGHTSVQDVIILVVYQHPAAFDRGQVPLYGLAILSRGAQDPFWLDSREAVGSYHIAAEDSLVVRKRSSPSPSPPRGSGPRALTISKAIIPEDVLVDASAAQPTCTLAAAVKLSYRALLCSAVSVCNVLPASAARYFGEQEWGPQQTPDDFGDAETTCMSLFRRRPTLSGADLAVLNSSSNSPLRDVVAADPIARSVRQVEVILWPLVCPFFAAPVRRMKILVPALRVYKTAIVAADEPVTAEDVSLLVWEDMLANHSIDPGSHWSSWGIARMSSPDSPIEPWTLFSSLCQPGDPEWWRETFVFARRPDQRPIPPDLDTPVEIAPPKAPPKEVAAAETIHCTVTLPQLSRFFQQLVSSESTVGAAVSRTIEKRADMPQPPSIDVSNYDVFCMAEDGTRPALRLLGQNSLMRDCVQPGRPSVVLELRPKPKIRSLALVFGTAYNLDVEIPSSAKLSVPSLAPPSASPKGTPSSSPSPLSSPSPFSSKVAETALPPSGVLVYSGAMTVREAVIQLTASWGLSSRFSFLVPDRGVPGNTCKAEAARSLWSYRMGPTDKVIFVDSELEQAAKILPSFIPGESVALTKKDVQRAMAGQAAVTGTLIVTKYRIFFVEAESGAQIEMPMTMICGIDYTPPSVLRLAFKDIRVEVFTMQVEALRDILRLIKPEAVGMTPQMPFIAKTPLTTFAWINGSKYPPRPGSGWATYDVLEEFSRIGMNPESWRITDTNRDFALCDTYPRRFVVPSAINDEDLFKIGQFRARSRVPAVCWVHRQNGAAIVRCAQPLTGWTGSRRCPEDENYVRAVLRLAPHADRTYIFDARANIAVTANTVSGRGGTERDDKAYPNCVLRFLGIGNIHSLRESYYKLAELCLQQPQQSGGTEEQQWLKGLDATGWLDNIHKILRAAALMAETISRGFPCICHCSDGWDRTPQLISLAQLMLDPFYRTIAGFGVLVEREWIAFGHQFLDRSSLGRTLPIGGMPAENDKQFAPVFVLWLDCVWQLTQQFPAKFEFDERLLLFLATSYYDGRFGTFLLSSEKERSAAGALLGTPSIWSHIAENARSFTNSHFSPADQSILQPTANMAVIRLWASYYLRYSPRLKPVDMQSLF